MCPWSPRRECGDFLPSGTHSEVPPSKEHRQISMERSWKLLRTPDISLPRTSGSVEGAAMSFIAGTWTAVTVHRGSCGLSHPFPGCHSSGHSRRISLERGQWKLEQESSLLFRIAALFNLLLIRALEQTRRSENYLSLSSPTSPLSFSSEL